MRFVNFFESVDLILTVFCEWFRYHFELQATEEGWGVVKVCDFVYSIHIPSCDVFFCFFVCQFNAKSRGGVCEFLDPVSVWNLTVGLVTFHLRLRRLM
jgi:hypothetical protein